MRKYGKTAGMLLISALLVTGTACGKKAETPTNASSTTAATMAVMESESETETKAEETKENLKVPASEAESSKEKETESKKISAVEELATKVQKAVADKDLEALADLIAFPIGIVKPDGEGFEVATKEDFLKLKPEDVFSDRLMHVIEDIKPSQMSMDKDDLAVMGKGTINIALGMTEEGSLKVVAISK